MSELDSSSIPETVRDTDGNDIPVVAVDSDSSPSAMLAAMAATAPDPVAAFIDQQAMSILATEMPKLYAVSKLGPARPVSSIIPLAEVYTAAMERLDAEVPADTKQLTATVRDCALNLAELLDSSIKRILLDDTHANRLALMDLSSCHARLVKTLADIALTPEQQVQIDEAEADA